MATAFINFRGEEHEVKFTDHGYEYDTGAHDVDWDFVRPIPGPPLIITVEEEQDIYDQLLKISAQGKDYYYDG